MECEVVDVAVVAVAVAVVVESARMAEDVETPALLILLLLDDAKAKARTAGVSCRLARQNIQTRAMDGDVECIQVSLRVMFWRCFSQMRTFNKTIDTPLFIPPIF